MIEKYEVLLNILNKYITEIPTRLNRKTSKGNIKLEHRNEFFEIKEILDNYIDKEEIYKRFLVLPGIRGVGKTTLLYQTYEYLLKKKDVPLNHIIFIL